MLNNLLCFFNLDKARKLKETHGTMGQQDLISIRSITHGSIIYCLGNLSPLIKSGSVSARIISSATSKAKHKQDQLKGYWKV